MPTYLTVKDFAKMFPNPKTKKPVADKTVRLWIEERETKPIIFDGKQYIPEKDPGGRCWRFKVIPAPLQDQA